jgi:asparagine synthase (glutamine-hydrolysing)
MCGIAGFISIEPVHRCEIEHMTNALLHRGPDAQGIYWHDSGTIALGHTRLSIIDLNAESNQPFYSASGRFVVTFNGEIYNFRALKKELTERQGVSFKTSSDTEVIAEGFAVWNTALVNRLEGMFAVAIVDRIERKICLFRDRMGKKPLFYFHSPGLFAFASEIKSLLRHPSLQRQISLNQRCISTFLHLGYIPEPDTIYNHIHKFPAGHIGKINADLNFKTDPYWKIHDHIHPREMDDRAALDHLRVLLENAVCQRLISDVPLGAFLSGGTDSSLITAVATRHVSSPFKTFNIGFKESKFDERQYARAVAKRLGTDHSEYELSEMEAVDLVEIYTRHFDEPFADTSAIPTMLVSKFARKEVKVILTGDGGDELFHGYGSYLWADRLDTTFLKMFKNPLRTLLLASGNNRLQRISHLLEPAGQNIPSHIFSQEQYFFSQRELNNHLLKPPFRNNAFTYDESFLGNKIVSPGERQALFDIQYYLKDDLLVKVDRASMYYALECRSPLLDHRVVEFAFSLNKNLKRRDGITKWLLKQLLTDYLPNDLVDRPKWGFSIPLGKWLRNDLHYLMDDFLNDQILELAGFVHIPYVRDLKKQFLSGKDYLYNRLWVIIVLHKWWKESCVQ